MANSSHESFLDCGLDGSMFHLYDKDALEDEESFEEGADNSFHANKIDVSTLNFGTYSRLDIEASANQFAGRGRKRAVLSDHQAIAIFDLRVPFYDSASDTRIRAFTSRSVVVSRMFGVSPKAVRDIWNKRTWRHCTQPMWTEADPMPRPKPLKAADEFAPHSPRLNGGADQPASVRRVGRPRGSKDSKPRRPRHEKRCASDCAPPPAPAHRLEHRAPYDEERPACPSAHHLPAAPPDRPTEPAQEEPGGDWAAPATRLAEATEGDGLGSSFPFFLRDFDEAAREPRAPHNPVRTHSSTAYCSAQEPYWSARH
jgi:hypothetical protein